MNSSSTRRKYSINQDEKKPIDLEVYHQSKATVIDYQYQKTLINDKKTTKCKIFNDVTNYIFKKISKGNVNTLLLELDIEFPLKQFKQLPEQFKKWMTKPVIVSILKQCVIRISEGKGEIEIELGINKFINQYPFFKCALIIWSRTRASQFLQKHRKNYEMLLGNERQIMISYGSQLRFTALEALVDSLNIKLSIQTHTFTQKYGTFSKQPKQLSCFFNNQNNDTVYIQDTITKDCQTTNTENSIQQPIPIKPNNRFQIDSSILSSLSPRSMNQGSYCTKCNNKIKFTRCTFCKEESGDKRQSNRLAQYVSLFKMCSGCNKKEIIYKGDYCRKCELQKN